MGDMSVEFQTGFQDGYNKKQPSRAEGAYPDYDKGYAAGFAKREKDEAEGKPYAQDSPMPGQQPRASVEFFESKEARKDFTHSEQKALIDENLEGRARNYDKLNLKGTHYELEQESSFDDFL